MRNCGSRCGYLAKSESEPKTDLGARIRDVRRKLGDPDRSEFADSLGISKNTLAYYERGERTPDASTLAVYHERFGVNLNWLTTGKGETFTLSSEDLSENDAQLLRDFRQLPENRQLDIMEITQMHLKRIQRG
ncbi:helix-turn-helix domain-containing protein [Agrobacterium vitis]|uniref:Helix-turn-helix domain-containing protein n=1 Tax=Agrobacterium vitis TaxID=373 RepID=A0ABD6G4K8_AGRVI|nr:helix-turn-helix domain-containing protein [Agrobacterium vitis]MUO78178.1 helix-turn-helix domain-containing protein [Agrobacterium vitis]MUO94055.1 helix-turn-helix domain-containing protein [Agrobacterium vitis]MUP03490.1 helix-turn-helix domain-containing protein [Agrobacterium vitis]MUZ85037.1 helix-turn-helix domain-containing protein [Agrobacterium vitis]